MFQQEEIDISTFNKQYATIGKRAIVVKKPTDAMVPVVMGHLRLGDVPLLVESGGDTKLITNISETAYNIEKLLNVCGGIHYIDDNGVDTEINNIEDYLEVFC